MTKEEKRQLLIEYLKEEIGYSIKMYENPSIKDWCTGTGILISMDDASLIVDALSTLPDEGEKVDMTLLKQLIEEQEFNTFDEEAAFQLGYIKAKTRIP